MTGVVRVLHPITRLIVGGAQENTMFTAALLDRQRFQAEILSGPQTGSEGSLIEEVRQREIPLAIFPDLLRQISPAHDMAAVWKMAACMRRGGYQIVHTHSSKAGILGRFAARMAGVPIIVHTVHGWSFHPHMSPALRQTYILLERLAARMSDAMIVVARQDIDKGLREGIGREEQYCVIRSAIPLEDFNPERVDRTAIRKELGIPPEAVVVGNVGRFSEQKNPLDWVRVAGKVARSLPDVHFLLVGDGPLRPEVEAALRNEGIAGQTTLTGLRREVPELMGAMNIFLLTSLWEGLPRVLPQAMAMQLPVVANRADGTVEVVEHGETGFLCTPGDLETMAASVVSLARQPELRRAMGARGQERARKEFDVHQMVAQIAALYERLLSQKIAKHH